MCELLAVSPSGDSAWIERRPGVTEKRRDELASEIRTIHAAVKERYGSPRRHAELVAHSDRGSPYAGEDCRRALAERGIACSTSRRGNCDGNAPVESFFATPKREPVHREDYATIEAAEASVFEVIEVFCNGIRRHSSPGYAAPAEFEGSEHPQLRARFP